MKIGKFTALEPEVRDAMLDLAGIKHGDKHIDLGSGEGQFVVEAKRRGAISVGYEIEKPLADESKLQNVDIVNGDLFDADVSKADVITFWFTDKVGTPLLLDKLYKEMKKKSRLVMLHSSLRQWRDGVFIPEENGVIPHIWQPTDTRTVSGNRFHLYIR